MIAALGLGIAKLRNPVLPKQIQLAEAIRDAALPEADSAIALLTSKAPIELPAPVRVIGHDRSRKGHGFLTVSATPWGALYVDGKRVAEQTPVYKWPLSAGEHTIAVFFPERGVYSRPRKILVAPGQTEVVGFN